ncbi:ATP-binding cassette domain-containing protein [Clostridium sardiniense]|uniref:ATP-binding cassette domain-containing protein n=1 Tax=Clostridium sardiniense TaxID=29369 RepID=A0ABS7KTT8_CLOSR|nr:ATP-binding cassette domain-containing protein [Clostridium sardiniense]MBY0754144.1 ATP-binding cassette domain-containing protein [Clostridium sardiniense]MDQ0459332.1 putative ABC transport system ATP-binding protein [Clostridium sardiniense]
MKILELNKVYYDVDHEKNIINGVSFQVNEGDCISIIGESGSGKSTLMKVCADLIEIESGSIKYRDKEYEDYEPTELRRKVSYCTQSACLFGDTVYDNLEFPFKIRNNDVDKDKMIYFLNLFNLDESYLDKQISSLSGGERQRVGLIRNVIFKPDILLLDEVTSALDISNTKNIQDYVKKINSEGVTVLWITHSEEQSTSIFNKRIIFSKGNIEKMEELN